MPKVDLSKGSQGIIEFSNGERFWCPIVGETPEVEEFETGSGKERWINPPGTFKVRIESGWYNDYTKDGKLLEMVRTSEEGGFTRPYAKRGARDIVAFVPCGGKDKRAKGLESEATP